MEQNKDGSMLTREAMENIYGLCFLCFYTEAAEYDWA